LPRAPTALSAIRKTRLETIDSATLAVETSGEGFFEITRDITRFLTEIDARDGVVLLHLRHTSASLVIQENADPAVQTDLVTALKRIAPDNAGWIHDSEGPDDMPSHIKAMVNGVSLHVPVAGGKLALGTWQGIYVAEHRTQPHRRDVIVQFLGTCGSA
jgi:secondary thiamine-phosphate synthase enzyme